MRAGLTTDYDWSKQGIGDLVVSFELYDQVHQRQFERRVLAAKETCHKEALELGEVGDGSSTFCDEFRRDVRWPSRVLRTLDLEKDQGKFAISSLHDGPPVEPKYRLISVPFGGVKGWRGCKTVDSGQCCACKQLCRF